MHLLAHVEQKQADGGAAQSRVGGCVHGEPV
jgi:hypothetical protein